MNPSFLRKFKIPLEISSWGVFAIALLFYWLTVDPGVSYWDCAEYVTAASKMEIGHPPGNPIWILTMRVATIPFPPELHALVINLCSGLFMAFASFFLCRVIFVPLAIGFSSFHYEKNGLSFLCSIVSIGATLCFVFCDSAWFSAVEAEVYAMSAMLTGASLWIMVKWWFEPSRAKRLRLLILLSYLVGLSLGVHQLNLLCIPVYVAVIAYKKYQRRISPVVVIFWLLASVVMVIFILFVLLSGSLTMASLSELFFVNQLGLPFDSGVLIFIAALIVVLAIIIVSAHLTHRYKMETAVWMLSFLLLGFSSYAIVMIRSSASPFMNEGAPSDIFALSAYFNRDQYPSTPLIYGHTPYSKPVLKESFTNSGKPVYSRFLLKKGKPLYRKALENAVLSPRSGFVTQNDSLENIRILTRGKDGYILSDYMFSQVLTPELNMWFPRLTSRSLGDRRAYADWAGMYEDEMNKVAVSEIIDSIGNFSTRINDLGERETAYSLKPTYTQNFRFFMSYQLFYMYLRYLLWNFAGRQNDYSSTGEIDHGNFITGVSFIDNQMLGDTEKIPGELWKDNPGHNNYYGIPFILGILGLLWLACSSWESRRILTVSGVFFIMTGVAIVVYLNQSPGEPRERDYTFLGSYMAFSMWIAAGLFGIVCELCKVLKGKMIYLVTLVISLFPGALMAAENFDDHDRRNRFEPTFYASSLLDFEIPAIIFSHGDNSTFPLWYASEVLEEGKDHIPLDVSYMSLPGYILGLKSQTGKDLKTIADKVDLAYDAFLLTRIPPDSTSAPEVLSDALKTLYSQRTQPAVWPTSKILIPYSKDDNFEINLHDFTGGSAYLSFRHLMLLDILAAQQESDSPKTLFFPYLIDWNLYKPLKPLLKESLFGKIYNPSLTDSMASVLLKQSVDREIKKLEALNPRSHYADPVIADRSRRYRGELVMAANSLLADSDMVYPLKIIDFIEKFYPYEELYPSTFTIEDSTYYEGKEYLYLLENVYLQTHNPQIYKRAERHKELLEKKKKEYRDYYESLDSSQRKTLSQRSLRNLM